MSPDDIEALRGLAALDQAEAEVARLRGELLVVLVRAEAARRRHHEEMSR